MSKASERDKLINNMAKKWVQGDNVTKKLMVWYISDLDYLSSRERDYLLADVLKRVYRR